MVPHSKISKLFLSDFGFFVCILGQSCKDLLEGSYDILYGA